MTFTGFAASVYVYNKLGDDETSDIRRLYLRKHRETAKLNIEAMCTLFSNLFLLRCA